MSSNNTSESSQGSKPSFSGYAYYTIGLSTSILLLFTFITVILYFCSRRISMNPTRVSQHSNSSFDLRSIITAQHPPPATNNNNNPAQVGVDDETLKTYPMLLYSELKRKRRGNSSGDSGATCSICLGDFSDNEWLRELPDCGHLFHRKCIDMWLRMNSSCPLCRTSPLPSPVSTPLAEVVPLARSGA